MSDAKHTDKHTKTQECVPKRTETHGDLISRKAAIDAMGERPIVWVGFDYEIGQRNQYDMDKLAIETVPPAEPDWIPVNERLPEDSEPVLVWYEYFRYGDYNCMFKTYGIGYYHKNFDIWGGDVSGHKARVFAWMPLPEPYKVGEQE